MTGGSRPRGVPGPAPLRAYLETLRTRLQAVFGTELLGVYVAGSVALGDYVPGRSDVDVAAVCHSPPSEQHKRATVAELSHPELPCPTRGLEFVLYTAAVAASAGTAYEINLNTGPGMRRHVSLRPAEDPGFWFVLDRMVLRTHGVPLLGPPRGTAASQLPPSDVRALLRHAEQAVAAAREADSGRAPK
jgi:Nucleotidyltransferase domain